jgi:hypothetical protein
MLLGPFVERMRLTSARRASTIWDRAIVAAVAAGLAAGIIVVWDWNGWDRASILGSERCALAAFAAVIAAGVVLGLGIVAGEVSPGAAQERDKKMLDALLATRLSSAEIVLGMLAAGLVKSMASLSAVLPVLVLVVFLGGVDPRLVLLLGAGLVTTLCAVGAISIAASVVSRTAQRSLGTAMALALIWWIVPLVLVLILPRLWPAAGAWIKEPALWLLQSTPLGVVFNLVGLVRRSSFVGSVLRMIELQTAGAAALVLWAIWRLRPASRALYDGEGRAALARMLRRRRRARPACGDDPVLWHEMHSTHGMSAADIVAWRVLVALGILCLVYMTTWFAVPAFAELAERGYSAPKELAMPELHPLARMMVVKLSKLSLAQAPGQARLEFNIVLRQASAVLVMLAVLVIAGCAAEGVALEKDRDTWLGLIATPLSGWEILRAKMIGAAWRMRPLLLVLVGLWVVGLLSGALHPLGFAAALVALGAMSWFFAALGTYMSLWSPDRKQATGRVMLPALCSMSGFVLPFLPAGFGSVLMGVGSMSFLTWASLLSYDDIFAATHSGNFPQLAAVNIRTGEGAGGVLATVLVGITAHLVGAALLTRAACRGFDLAAGRPTRSATKTSRGDHILSAAPGRR